ncbi:45497_t:CDS:1, partial [Gigaspora margarita]
MYLLRNLKYDYCYTTFNDEPFFTRFLCSFPNMVSPSINLVAQ